MSDSLQDDLMKPVKLTSRWRVLLCGTTAMLLILSAGCSRSFWRQQADRDVYRLVSQKLNDPAWAVPRMDITPDPRSRFFDPYDLDKGPLPPDDPAAGEYMLQVAGKRGYKSWHKFGEALSVENPHWLEAFGLPAEPEKKNDSGVQQASFTQEPSSSKSLPKLENLTLPQVLELSYIHSREYQNEIENVYLRALELSFERFQFDVRYLGIGGNRPTADLSQTSIPSTSDNTALDTRGGISQLLPSGGQWAVELANRTLWMFSGPNQMNTASTISYSLVQPLLFQAGRKIALENLTQAERTLLYSVRDLARFRKVFFTNVVGGPNGFLSVLRQRQVVSNERDNIRRVLEQLALLKVLSSQRTITFYEDLPALPAGLTFPPNVAGQIRYDPLEKRLYFRGAMSANQQRTLLGLSQDPAYQKAIQSIIRRRIFVPLDALPANLQIPQNLAGQLIYNAAEKRLYWRGPMSEAQERLLDALSNDNNWKTAIAALTKRLRSETLTQDMLQLQSRLLSSENRLRAAEQNYQDLLDRFKLVLGLPTNMPISIDMAMLNQFQLIDPKVSQTEKALKDFVLEWAKLDEDNPDPAQLRTVLKGLNALRSSVQNNVLSLIRSDLETVKKRLPERLSRLETDDDRLRVRGDIERDEELLRSTETEFSQLSRVLQSLIADTDAEDTKSAQALQAASNAALGTALGQKFPDEIKKSAVGIIATLREDLLKITQNAQVIQIGLRVELITLEQFTDSIEDVQRKALANRLDLKNARAEVMDARRRVEIAANRLEAVLNLRVEGDISTRQGNKPLDFRGRQSSFRVGLGFTAPLDQVNARNAYRDAQIDYQRARRAYMALEDQIRLQVRQSWRNLDALRKNFETARQSVRISALEFDSAVEQASAPGQPVNRNSGLTLLNALNSVLTAQNGLIQIWVEYERSRLNIYRDMGMMEIDAQGVWKDDYYQKRLPATQTPSPPPASSGERRDDETRRADSRRPELHNLQRISGSVRIRKRHGGGSPIARLATGDRKRSTIDWPETPFFENHSQADNINRRHRGDRGWSVRLSLDP
ncbi:MAG: hypothetical protein Tsb009_19360 [Planctomycetaceae bacterium]